MTVQALSEDNHCSWRHPGTDFWNKVFEENEERVKDIFEFLPQAEMEEAEEPIESVRFLYETERVEKVECGEHLTGDEQSDLLINTHGCGDDD